MADFFVGYSYDKADEAMIAKFLSFFDTLHAAQPSFTWDHARKPRAKRVSEKVIDLFEGKDALIAICSRKDRLVPRKLKAVQGKLAFGPDEAVWKTSDWIIQEIGFALGRGIKLIILVEEGVQDPGSMQADVERIYFKRANPSACFDDVTRMIADVLPGQAAFAAVSASQVAVITKPEEVGEDELIFPDASWGFDEYRAAFAHLVIKGRQDEADKIDDAFRASALAAPSDVLLRWRLLVEFARIKFGKGGDLAVVRRLAAEHPDSSQPLQTLGHALEHYGEPSEAATTFARAAVIESSVARKVTLLELAAESARNAKDGVRARQYLQDMVEVSGDSADEEGKVLWAIRNADANEQKGAFAVAAGERLLTLDPSDTWLRFNVAFAQSSRGEGDIPMLHYEKIPEQERSGAGWNNLGANYQNHGMEVAAVSAFRRGVEMGESLAMANLASTYLRAGFLNEADELLKRASALDDRHPHVAVISTERDETLKVEAATRDRVLELAGPKREFYERMGRALLRPNVKWLGAWAGPECELRISVKAGKLILRGEFEVDNTGIVNALLGRTLGSPYHAPSKTRYSVRYEGEVLGGAFDGTYSKTQEEPVLGLLGAYVQPSAVHAYISEDGSKLHLMENAQDDNPTFYVMTRVKDNTR